MFVRKASIEWLLSFMHWLIMHIGSEILFVKNLQYYKCYIWMVSFLHELRPAFREKSASQPLHSKGFMNYTFRSCFVKSLAWLYLTKTYWETFLFCKNFSRKEVAQAYWILDLLNRNCCCISSIHRNKLIGVSNKFKQDFVVHLCISNS